MRSRIEGLAVIGNCETMARVGRDGSIDWLGLLGSTAPPASGCFGATHDTGDVTKTARP
jgi:hypothetical protein